MVRHTRSRKAERDESMNEIESLTVQELIEELQTMPADAHVVFESDYGDICHTQQALPVMDVAELIDGMERLEKSAYSRSGVAIEQRDPTDDGVDREWEDAPAYPPIVILR